jgi:hypothetical protein
MIEGVKTNATNTQKTLGKRIATQINSSLETLAIELNYKKPNSVEIS